MKAERWQQVERLYHAALEREPDERAAFLDEACAGDEELRREVSELLAFDDPAASFIEIPALKVAAEMVAEDQTSVRVGQTVSHYHIISSLGAGGMGEVYLAEDTSLNRRVALKLLPSLFVKDKDRLRRFAQEARAASALNHPNIITIHEIGEIEDTHYIVIEYVAGETLRRRIASTSGEGMKLAEAVEMAAQVSAALAAAHEAGITHRDIKPENVMVRPDGIVKVLDFGLAKLTEVAPSVVDSRAATLVRNDTETGMVMGTPGYMSPEQARGERVDARTDIFSLGAMLYEMVAGRPPFAGATTSEIIAALLRDEPPPLIGAPPALERIVSRALHKDRAERYQTANEMLADLRRLKQNLDSESHSQRSAPTKAGDETATANVAARSTGPRAGRLRGSRFSTRRAVVYTAVLIALTLGTLGYLWRWRQTSVAPQTEIKSLAVLPLKSLDAGENYLGLGIADTVIRRISQTGELIVRPTSAVRRYLNEDTDALAAARQLNADAVLEGSVQRADDRLRVSVNLLRTSDGASLWTDNFDMQMTDIFTIQDAVAQQVASRLHLQLDPSQQARLTKRYTSNAIAYQFYLKGVYTFDQRVSHSKSQWEATIDFFKRAIEADPNFALAHAQLAYAYAVKAVFFEPTEAVWAERAREEINRAQTLDSQLAETHLARFQLLYSIYEGFQGEAAVREVLLAQQLNPNVGHVELAHLYLHLGLEDLAAPQLQRAFEIDPTSVYVKDTTRLMYIVGCKYDEYAAHRELYRNDLMETWYFMGTGRLAEAQRAIEEWSPKRPDDIILPPKKALLLALKGDFGAAEEAIPSILGRHPVKDPLYHHAAYDIACIYALEGKSGEAVKWLREAAATGYSVYPLFERDAYLNRIRQAPEFIQFMAEMKAQNERYRREFAQTP